MPSHARRMLAMAPGDAARDAGVDDERLGGSRGIAGARPAAPAGFVVEAVAAGFTDPRAVVVADGVLYLCEAGHPRRTPPRLFRVEPESGAASLLATFERAADESPPWITMAGGRPLVTHDRRAWRVRPDGELVAWVPGFGESRAAVGLVTGSWLAEDGWYLCDAGSRHADGSPAPGAGIVWRLRGEGTITRPGSGGRAFLSRKSQPDLPAIPATALAAGVGLGATAIALALYYRARRRRSAAPEAIER